MTDSEYFYLLLCFLFFSARKIAGVDLEDLPEIPDLHYQELENAPAMPHLRYPVVREEFLTEALDLPVDVDPVILTSIAYFHLGDLRNKINQFYKNSRQKGLNTHFLNLQTTLVTLIIQWNRDQTTEVIDIVRLTTLYDTSSSIPEGSQQPPNYERIGHKAPFCNARWNPSINSNFLRGKTTLNEINYVLERLPRSACISAYLYRTMINHIRLEKDKRQCEMNLIRRIDVYINSKQSNKDEQLLDNILQLILQVDFFFEEIALAENGDFAWDQNNKMWLQEAIQYPELISPVVLGNLKFLPNSVAHQILSFYDRCFENGNYPDDFEEWDELLARAVKQWKKNKPALHKLYVVINWVMMQNSLWIHSEGPKMALTSQDNHKLIREGYNPKYDGKKEFKPEDLNEKSKLSDIKNVIDTLPPDVSLHLTMIQCWSKRNNQIQQIEEEIIEGIQQFLSEQGTLYNLRSVVLKAFDSVLDKFAETIIEKSMEVDDESLKPPTLFKLFGKQLSFSGIEKQIETVEKPGDSSRSNEMKIFGRQISLSRIEKLSVVEIATNGFPFHADVNWTSTWKHFLNVMDLPSQAHPIIMDSLLILPMTAQTMIVQAYNKCHDVFAPHHQFKFMEKTLIIMILKWRSKFFDISIRESMLATAKNLRLYCSAAMADKVERTSQSIYRPISESILCTGNEEIKKFDESVVVGKTELSKLKNVIMALPSDSCVRVILMRNVLAKKQKNTEELAEIEKSIIAVIGDYLKNKNSSKLSINLANLSNSLFEVFEKQYYYELQSNEETDEDEATEFMKTLSDFKYETSKYREQKPHEFMFPSILRIKRHLNAEYQQKLQTLYNCLADQKKINKITQDSVQVSTLAAMLSFIDSSKPKVFQGLLDRNLNQHCPDAKSSRKRLDLDKPPLPSGKKTRWDQGP